MWIRARGINQIITNRDPQDARQLQRELAPLVCIPLSPRISPRSCSSLTSSGSQQLLVLALDVAYSDSVAVASAVLWDSSQRTSIWQAVRSSSIGDGADTLFPYVPGLLAFREIPLLHPLIDEALAHLHTSYGSNSDPNVVLLCDGLGIAHPQGLGLASHLGILYDLPSIGMAKNRFWGQYDMAELADLRGSRVVMHKPLSPCAASLKDDEDRQHDDDDDGQSRDKTEVGHVLRTQDGINPIFVSPGHRVSLDEVPDFVLHLCSRYRIPDPLRFADHIGRLEIRRLKVEMHAKQMTRR